MKTTWTILSVIFTLVGSLMAVEARAGGPGHSSAGFSGISHSSSFSSQGSTYHPTSSLGSTNFASVQNFQQSKLNSSALKTGNQFLVNHNPSGLTKTGSLNSIDKIGHNDKLNLDKLAGNKPNLDKLVGSKLDLSKSKLNNLNLNKGLSSNLNKNFAKFDFGKSMKPMCFPGKFGWGFGWGGWCGWGGCWNNWYCGCWPGYCGWWPGYCCYDPCCYEPCCYEPCYNVCYEYCVPQTYACVPTPVVRTVQIVNPNETQATLGFAINGKPYSLEAGKSQQMELTDNMVIEFDRGDNNTGRYALSEGVYRFGSTPQGWELYHSNDAPLADAVAAD